MAAMACPDAGPSTRAGAGLTRFVFVNCSASGRLSSRGLFLHRAAVRRHISASKACFAADLGYKEIQIEARPGDVMAGAGGAAGPAPEVRHQPPGTTIYICYNYVLSQNNAAGIAVKASRHYARGLGFETSQLHIFAFCIFLCTYKHELVHSMYVPSIYIL